MKIVPREKITRWAQSLLKRGIVVFDTETTGLGERHQIVEIAIVDGNTDEVLYDSFVKPSCAMDPNALKVNNITPDLYASAPTMKTELPVIGGIVGDRPMGAYNADFDGKMLKYTARAFGYDYEPDDMHCIMIAYKYYVRSPFKIRLTAACESFEIEMGTAHRALTDALAAARVLRAMAEGREPIDSEAVPAHCETNPVVI
jgi:DNA polymerase-3 subunit epsilon